MTCITGLVNKEKGYVVMGADSLASSTNSTIHRKDKKIFRLGDFVVGCTTSYRMTQIIQFSFVPPQIKDKDLFEYMCTDFVNKLIECFEENLYSRKYDGQIDGGTFIIAYKDRLFKIYDDFQVAESQLGYHSCGSGEEYALGSLYTSKELKTKDRVIEAIKAASYFSPTVGGEIHIITT